MNFIVIAILAAIFLLILIYNTLVSKRNMVENALSQIDVQLKRRSDLIPKLVEVVKGYAKHERGLLKDITEARSAMLRASSIGEKASADANISEGLKRFFAIAESYPKLKANKNFLALQEEISSTENRIAYARQFYNDMVMAYNTMLAQFPYNLVAMMFSFKPAEFFKTGGVKK